MATTITSPNRDYTDDVVFGDGTRISFKDGRAEVDELSDSVRTYLRGAGYGIDSDPDEPEQPDVPDPREVNDGLVGTNLRDAAVDPHPDDFLPPINAGKEGDEGNPHGPNVVAPEIHAAPDQAVVPGPVGRYVEVDTTTVSHLTGEDVEGKIGVVESDTDLQQERESEYAERVLIGDEPVGEVLADMGGVPDSLTPAGLLTGMKLNAALREAGLSTKGSPDERRARLAAHQQREADENPDDIPGAQSTADQAEAEGLEGDDQDREAAEEKLEG